MNIPIASPQIGEIEQTLALEVLRSGMLAQGEMVERFEEAVRDVVQSEHAIAVNNGTSALIASLLAAGIGRGDEVITSPLTFIATLNAILFVGATPRFADVTEDYTIDPASAAALITDSTRAILPVHLYGKLSQMDELIELARAHDLMIIEDAAQALGACSPSGNAGTFGLGCFSFYATKNVTTGEGGIITTSSAEQARVLRQLRNQGQLKRYEYMMAGYNFRMTELDAAVGVGQMSRLAYFTERRRQNARRLAEGLDGIPGLVSPSEPENEVHVFNQFTIRVEDDAPISRDDLRSRLSQLGIGTAVYYPKLVYEYDYVPKEHRPPLTSTPRAADFTRRVLSLPVHPGVELAQIERIIDAVRQALGRRGMNPIWGVSG